MVRNFRHIARLAAVPLLLATFLSAPALAEENDELALSLGLADDEQVTASRFPRPVSKIAENVTVITADDISRINAHTLAEVLQTVPGIQLNQLQSPGSTVFFTILGATSSHILVQLDGVPLNFLSLEHISEVGEIPVQMIERMEIVKGASSAAWGPALGGVINIITKSPATGEAIGGMASASIAEKETADLRAELSGTVQRFGYYLTGGNIHSDGLTPGNANNLNHVFGKFTYDLPDGGKSVFGVDFRDNSLRLLRSYEPPFPPNGYQQTADVRYLNSYLSLHLPLADRLSLEVKGRAGERIMKDQRTLLEPKVPLRKAVLRESYHGAALGVNWGDSETNVSAGVEYDKNDFKSREPVRSQPFLNYVESLERLGGYLNGTFTVGRFSILPGIRYEHNNEYQDVLSYTLGATVRLTDSTLFRAYSARGYNMPMLSPLPIANGERQLQNVWTHQAGIESSAIPYLWLKGTLFYNRIWKVQSFDQQLMALVLRSQIRQGIDLEFRTSPVYGFALTGGYTYTDAWDRDTRAELSSNEIGPRQSAKVGLNYDNDGVGLRGALTGNYVDWYLPDQDYKYKDTAVIWDLHLTKKLRPADELSPELFFSVRNIFNGAQYTMPMYPNNPRWFEGGMRYRF